jgi:hypothetical protein
MLPTITCAACGTVLGVPKGGVPKDGLPCNWCGYITLPSAEIARPSAKPTRRPDPAAAAPPSPTEPVPAATTPASSPPRGAPYQWGDDEDDNGQPYDLPPDEVKTRKCEKCRKDIDLVAIVCVHCGFDTRAKQKVERVYSPVDRTWEAGWPFQRRMALFLAFQGLNLLTLIISLVAGEGIPITFFGIAFTVTLQAFVIGTYDTLRIRRNKKGQAEITVQWRVGFVPMAVKKLNWREHEGIAFGHYDPTGLSDWWIFFVLLPWFILPAILWYFFVIRADRFFAALARDRGYPETYLYRGMSEPQAKEICQVATDVTALPLVTPL